MKTKAIIVAYHKYTPFGDRFYEPIFDYMLGWLKKYQDEYDRVYFVDSNWKIMPTENRMFEKATVISVDPHLRYYDAYREVLPQIKEDLVLFMDNDMVVYKPTIISGIFSKLDNFDAGGIEVGADDVVSIYDTIGEKHFQELNGQSKFCPYFFATRKNTLMNYLDLDWGSHMPIHETFGYLTEAMLMDGLKPKEMEEDKSNFLFGEELGDRRSKNLGYYHIRSGSTPAYLLSHRERGDKQYWDYLKNQPRSEYLRQFAFYQIMGGDVSGMLEDLKIGVGEWDEYVKNFRIFHGL